MLYRVTRDYEIVIWNTRVPLLSGTHRPTRGGSQRWAQQRWQPDGAIRQNQRAGTFPPAHSPLAFCAQTSECWLCNSPETWLNCTDFIYTFLSLRCRQSHVLGSPVKWATIHGSNAVPTNWHTKHKKTANYCEQLLKVPSLGLWMLIKEKEAFRFNRPTQTRQHFLGF